MRERRSTPSFLTACGCGTMLKDYGNLLARDHGYAERAAYVAGLARDVTEFLSEIGLNPPVMWTGLKVAYHSACSLQHGQKLDDLPPALLEQAGYTLTEIPEGHLCCGSAGTYNICSSRNCPASCGTASSRTSQSIAPDVIVTGNIGCITQLKAARISPSSTRSSCWIGRRAVRARRRCPRCKGRAHPIEALVEMAKASAKEKALADLGRPVACWPGSDGLERGGWSL